jgi:hypothetical protein
METPKILTVRQPWAWAIIHGGKDIENRTWPVDYRGPVIIHAGRAFDDEGFDLVHKLCDEVPDHDLFWSSRGKIIGRVDIVDCVKDYSSLWAETGDRVWNWVLANPVPARHSLTVRGQLGLRTVGDGWERAF